MPQHHVKHPNQSKTESSMETIATRTAEAANESNSGGMLVSVEQIRTNAFQKWEAAGRPIGNGVEFWLEAERELQAELKRNSNLGVHQHAQEQHERVEVETAVKANNHGADGHYRNNNRMFQSHGDRGHRHGENIN